MPDSEEFLDPYLDPETGVLRNLIGARTKKSLEDAEGSLSFARLVQLMDRHPKPTGDLTELRAIHRHLFQDLYGWAGQIRTVDIRKNVECAGFFLPSGMIERASAFAARELQSDSALRGLDRGHLIDRLAYHYDQVNYIHPFRGGNGRVQRVFWNRIALAAGWQLDWRPVHGDVNDRASRAASDQRDLGPLRATFDQIVTLAPPVRNRGKSWREAERQRMSFTKPKAT
ncbi:MAG: Fic/DOC family protein [Trebonia sp.]